jgi:hypothetical protein
MSKQKVAGTFIDPILLDEQRTSCRVKTALRMEALLLDEPDIPIVPIKCRDASTHGMGFFSQRAFRPDERFVVRFYSSKDGDRLMLCRVRHCIARSAESYQGGAEFLDAVTPQAGSSSIPAAWMGWQGA